MDKESSDKRCSGGAGDGAVEGGGQWVVAEKLRPRARAGFLEKAA